MEKEIIKYYFNWMNRARFKSKNGNLNIRHSKMQEDEEKALQKFEGYTKSGYPIQLMKAVMKSFGTKDGIPYYAVAERIPVKENERWTYRMREDKVNKLKRSLAFNQSEVKRIEQELKEMEETHGR